MVTSGYNGTSSTWTTWNNSYSTSASTSINCSASSNVWYTWTCDVGTTAATTSNTVTWNSWNTQYTYTHTCTERTNEQVEEQRILQERQAQEYAQLEKETKAKEKLKSETARQLLREVLSDEQNNQLDKDGYFELTALNSGNKYRVTKGRSRNVKLLDKDNKPIRTLCFHPGEYVHNYDTMAAQKLMLENSEEEVQKVANYS